MKTHLIPAEDGDVIRIWQDKSGNSRDAYQDTYANRGAFDDTNDEVTIDGSNTYYNVTNWDDLSPVARADDMSYTIVYKSNSTSNQQFWFQFKTDNNNWIALGKFSFHTDWLVLHHKKASVDRRYNYQNSLYSSNVLDGNKHIMTLNLDYSAETMDIWLDGVNIDTVSADTVGAFGVPNTPGLFIYRSATITPANGNCHSILFYNSIPSDDEIGKLHTYLAKQFNITI